MSLNKLTENLQATIILDKFVIKWAYSFRKNLCHWSKFKARLHDIFLFLKNLILFQLTLVDI